MIALLPPPAFKPAFDCEVPREARAADADKVARLIAHLHAVLLDPNAAPGVAAEAKRMLLAVLEQTKDMRALSMIMQPNAERPVRPVGELPAEPTEAELLPGTCVRPVAPPPAWDGVIFPERALSGSPAHFRGRRVHSHSARVSPDGQTASASAANTPSDSTYGRKEHASGRRGLRCIPRFSGAGGRKRSCWWTRGFGRSASG